EFGPSDEVLQLLVNYDGHDGSEVESGIAALTARYAFNNNLSIKWISSYTQIREREDTRLSGWYAFDERGGGLGEGNNASVLGRGTLQDMANNQLKSKLLSTEIRVYKQFNRTFFESGIRFQLDQMEDEIHEFSALDTSGY